MGRRKKTRVDRKGWGDGNKEVPEHKRISWWIGVITIPLVLTLVAALLASYLSIRNAGEQEAAAQSGANQAVDAELGKKPPLVADVRHLFPINAGWIWVFDEPLDEARMTEMDANLRKYAHYLLNPDAEYIPERDEELRAEAEQNMRAAGGTRVAAECFRMRGEYDCRPASHYMVTLTGHRRERVRVLDMRVRVLSREEPPAGTLLEFPPQGGGPVERVVANLDEPGGSPLLADGTSGDASSPYFDVRTLWLENGESHGFEVIGVTRRCRCAWELVFRVGVGDKQEDVVVRSDGTASGPPFETVSWGRDTAYGGTVAGRQAGGHFHFDFDSPMWTKIG